MYNIEQSAKHAELNDSTNAMTSMTIYTNPFRLQYVIPRFHPFITENVPRDYNSVKVVVYRSQYNPLGLGSSAFPNIIDL